jgi:hypothetical protein
MSSTAPHGVSSTQDAHGAHALPTTSALGPYSRARAGSGTSWQPDATPLEGRHFNADGWALMAHGFAKYGSGPRSYMVFVQGRL